MQSESPRLLVVDDDRAVLTLVGTGVSCLDVLRALRTLRPECEAVLTTGYASLRAAVDALRDSTDAHGAAATAGGHDRPAEVPAPLSDVERNHIVRTLAQVGGNKALAARLLGVSRRAFYRQLERHGLHQRIPMSQRTARPIPGEFQR